MKPMRTVLPVKDYDLAGTLSSGQAFRWQLKDNAWEGIVGQHWVRLQQGNDSIIAETAQGVADWEWLTHYLQLNIDLDAIVLSFPDDEPLRLAVPSCRGLRLLRQEPWETLASFICSSTKQIVQIQQIVSALCQQFGNQLVVPPGHEPVYAFPTAERLAACSESDLRGCKMGFRAPNLLATAKRVASGEINLHSLYTKSLAEARAELVELPGVGRKIADCVLLFAYGFQQAFPIDVWILKALKQLYFPRRRPTMKKLLHFSETHFGPYSGYAQQYLFHYMRTKQNRSSRGDEALTSRAKK